MVHSSHKRRQFKPVAMAGRALLAWVALAALVFTTTVSPLIHASLHERLFCHEQEQASHWRPTGTGWVDAARQDHERHACPVCLTLAGLHLARPAPVLAPAPEFVVIRAWEGPRSLRLGILQPLGFRHRGPPSSL